MQSALDYLHKNREQYLEELKHFLAIPSVSSDPERNADTAHCAEFTADMLKSAGFDNAQVNPTSGHPIVTAEWTGAPGKPTVLIYGHYDVQPVDPVELWNHDPFDAWIENDRIIARGSADDKGQVFMHIKALEAVHKTIGEFPVNLKLVIEGEEEVGSPSLPGFLKEHRGKLASDVALVSDCQMWAEGIPAITIGLRGLTYMEIEFTGPNRDLHSGSYGGAVANPAEILARMLAKVKNEQGVVQIPGFYDRVVELSHAEKAALVKVPHDEAAYMADLGVRELWGENGYSTIERKWSRPTFEINGIWSGFTGVGAKTVLPSKATVKVSMRLVPDQDPDEIARAVEKFFIEKSPRSVQARVTRFHGGKPVVVPLDSPYMRAAAQALKESFDQEPYFIREGGSIPIVADFKDILGVDTLLVGYCLPDARTHSPNENFHLPSFYTGMDSLVRMYYHLGGK